MCIIISSIIINMIYIYIHIYICVYIHIYTHILDTSLCGEPGACQACRSILRSCADLVMLTVKQYNYYTILYHNVLYYSILQYNIGCYILLHAIYYRLLSISRRRSPPAGNIRWGRVSGESPRLRPIFVRTSTKILDFRGFDSSRILILRRGILMSMGSFLQVLNQRIWVGIMLLERLGA